MTILLATLGFTPETVSHAIRAEENPEALFVFFGQRTHPKTQPAIARLHALCRELDLKFEPREIGSSYDFLKAAMAYRRVIQSSPGAKFLFNISGGTGVMQAAAALVSYTHAIPMVYYNLEEKRYVRMPPLLLKPAGAVTAQQAKILQVLLAAPDGLRPGDLARRASVSASNLDYHVNRLLKAGLVESVAEAEGKRHRIRATEPAALLHG